MIHSSPRTLTHTYHLYKYGFRQVFNSRDKGLGQEVLSCSLWHTLLFSSLFLLIDHIPIPKHSYISLGTSLTALHLPSRALSASLNRRCYPLVHPQLPFPRTLPIQSTGTRQNLPMPTPSTRTSPQRQVSRLIPTSWCRNLTTSMPRTKFK